MTRARVWERRAVPADGDALELPLRFRAVPGRWPEIELAPPDGTRADVAATGHEIRVVADTGERGTLLLDVGGFRVAVSGRTVSTGADAAELPGSGPIELALETRGDTAVLTVDGTHRAHLIADAVEEQGAAPVTENITGFRLRARPAAAGRLEPGGETRIVDARVWGLRDAESALYRAAATVVPDAGRTFFATPAYAVADARVHDEGDVPALVPDSRTIVSPIRVVEEFEWRDTPYGDMTRVADRTELWRSIVEPGRFPTLTTGFRTVDAAFELGLETFQRNASEEFALPGETGLWSAGYFQGSGQGFGSWRRDTAHIALRAGNLIDPEVARASLLHVVGAGFDNGSDGDALPAVAIWDHYLATGDSGLVDATWPALTDLAAALDARFDARRGLVAAEQSTSNDLFNEPEAGGFALGTEVYAMASYDALARMAALPHVGDDRAAAWAERAAAMRAAILASYWNPELGFFTSGPAGSPGFASGVWETSGAEAALWFLGAGEERVRSTLEAMRSVAMSDYGVVLFPHRDDDNHFCHSVWYCWEAGLARAAAGVGDAALVHRLIAQQVRTVVLNKTFYEVTDARDGKSWRWPGQLWHAAGFVSKVLSGVFGVRYDERGMTFVPAVAREFEGARLEGLRYRAATLDLEIQGFGTRCTLLVDGRPAERLDAAISGRHDVILAMKG